MEKPPEERLAPISGEMPVVAPTDVMKGQPAGKAGTNVVHDEPPGLKSDPPTPPDPDAYSSVIPRTPSCIAVLQNWLYD